jgi:hypothetical protein
MNYRGVLVVAASAGFVAAMILAMNYAITGLGIQQGGSTGTAGVSTSCSASSAACGAFSMDSANLTTTSYSDELEPANFSTLGLGVTWSGSGGLARADAYVGSVLVGTISGPFPAGAMTYSMTVPATVIVTKGESYAVRLVGLDPAGAAVVQETITVVAG